MPVSKYDPMECVKTWLISHNSAGSAKNTRRNSENHGNEYSFLFEHLNCYFFFYKCVFLARIVVY